MANPAGLSVSESSVYRSLYKPNGLPNSLPHKANKESPQWRDSPGAVNPGEYINSHRWTFLQRLLAIEEAHDRKRREREGQKKNTYGSCDPRQGEQSTATEGDSLARWLYGQVLDESPEDSETTSKDHHLPHVHSCTLSSTASNRNIPSLPAISEAREGPGNELFMSSMQDMTPQRKPSLLPSVQDEDTGGNRHRRKRQLRLPPILLPKLYTVTPRPLQYREFLTPTKIRGPITDEEWEDLKDCRYIRHALPRFALQVSTSNISLI